MSGRWGFFKQDESPAIGKDGGRARLDIKTGPDGAVSLTLNDHPIGNCVSLTLFMEAREVPRVAMDFYLTELDVTVDDAIIEGWAHLVKSDDGEMYSLSKIVVPPPDEED